MSSKRALTGLVFLLALLACDSKQHESRPSLPPSLESSQQAIAETTRDEAIAEAPWRVQDADSVIPIDVVVADAYRTGVFGSSLELNYVMVSVKKDGTWVPFYYRDFGAFDLADSPFTDTLFVLHVTEGYGAGLIDGRPVTARNLLGEGFSTGLVELKAQVSATGPAIGKGADVYVINLQTKVAGTPLPQGWGRFEHWYAGDLHAHSMYTHNFAEYALPHRSMIHAATAIGLDWVISTDHSCDLDPTCSVPLVDNVSTRVEQWTFCEGAQALPCTRRDNSALPDGLAMARADAREAESWASGWSSVKLAAGEEVTLRSGEGKIVHMLALNAPYIHAPGSGAVVGGVSVDCDPVSLQVSDALSALPPEAIAVSAHPTQPLDSKINGGAWSEDDTFDSLTAHPQFYGIQLWNMRKARVVKSPRVDNPESSIGLNPFTSYPLLGDVCNTDDDPHECYPYFMEVEAVPYWDRLLSRACGLPDLRIVALAGTDSHGDFNYVTLTGDGLDIASANDAAFGTVRTVALAPSGAMADILEALRQGRTIMTDGPMVTFGIDRTGDGTIDQLDEDAQVGSQWPVAVGAPLRLHFKWQTTGELGAIEKVFLVAGDETTGSAPVVYDLFADPQHLGDCAAASRTSGACSLLLDPASAVRLPEKGTRSYYRVVAHSGARDPATGFYEYRALTNPIWLRGADCEDGDGDGYFAGLECEGLLGIVQARDCDDESAAVSPGAPELCNGADDDCDGQTDEELGSTTCGVGACQRTVESCANGEPQSCVPGTPVAELCNGIDDDCDAAIDEELAPTTCGVGACQRQVESCLGGAPQACAPGEPGSEVCNGLDDDCDGEVDGNGVCGAPASSGCSCMAGGSSGLGVEGLLAVAGLLLLLPARRRARGC